MIFRVTDSHYPDDEPEEIEGRYLTREVDLSEEEFSQCIVLKVGDKLVLDGAYITVERIG